jgi:hypothetical protein
VKLALPRAAREILLVAVLAAAAIGASYLAWRLPETDGNSAAPNGPVEGFPRLIFNSTNEYFRREAGIQLTVHSFRVTPDYLAVVYSVAADAADIREATVVLEDDRGTKYSTRSNVVLGNPHGLVVGLLVTEGYRPGGQVLSLRLLSAISAEGPVGPIGLSLPFVRNTQPGSAVNFVEAMRLSPEEGTPIGRVVVGLAGPPGGTLVEVLAVRDGEGAAAYGRIDEAGEAKALTQEEFFALVGDGGFDKPPTFPWPGR